MSSQDHNHNRSQCVPTGTSPGPNRVRSVRFQGSRQVRVWVRSWYGPARVPGPVRVRPGPLRVLSGPGLVLSLIWLRPYCPRSESYRDSNSQRVMSQSLGPVGVLSPVRSGSEVRETESPDARESGSAPDPVRVRLGSPAQDRVRSAPGPVRSPLGPVRARSGTSLGPSQGPVGRVRFGPGPGQVQVSSPSRVRVPGSVRVSEFRSECASEASDKPRVRGCDNHSRGSQSHSASTTTAATTTAATDTMGSHGHNHNYNHNRPGPARVRSGTLGPVRTGPDSRFRPGSGPAPVPVRSGSGPGAGPVRSPRSGPRPGSSPGPMRSALGPVRSGSGFGSDLAPARASEVRKLLGLRDSKGHVTCPRVWVRSGSCLLSHPVPKFQKPRVRMSGSPFPLRIRSGSSPGSGPVRSGCGCWQHFGHPCHYRV